MTADRTDRESRVLVLAPTGRDSEVTLRLLHEEGLVADAVHNTSDLILGIRLGAGAVILTDHLIHFASDIAALRDELVRQPHWSELPIVTLARTDSGAERLQLLRALPGSVLLDRPVNTRTLLSAVHAALRARTRQYEMRHQLEQIRIANQELLDAARAKDAFLATLAHELRNPLSALAAATRLMNADPAASPQTLLARQVIGRQVTQMTRLLDDLLDIARVTRNRLELRKEASRLAVIIQAAVETAQPSVNGKHHELKVTAPLEEIDLIVDPLRLSQVVSNLLTNAAKYTEPGGRIDLHVQCEDSALVIAVSDTGIGIPPESRQHIFEMFAQLRPALDRSEGGLGIGLALAKGLIELHGGSIAVESPGVGQGSTFTVRLPIESAPRAVAIEKAVKPITGRRILLADDNLDSLESLASLLRLDGHIVSVADNGAEVLRLVDREYPEVVLLDIGMPDMNGYEIAQRVRAADTGRHILLVAISGWGQSDDKRRAREAGFDHHFTKPVDLDALAGVLEPSVA